MRDHGSPPSHLQHSAPAVYGEGTWPCNSQQDIFQRFDDKPWVYSKSTLPGHCFPADRAEVKDGVHGALNSTQSLSKEYSLFIIYFGHMAKKKKKGRLTISLLISHFQTLDTA